MLLATRTKEQRREIREEYEKKYNVVCMNDCTFCHPPLLDNIKTPHVEINTHLGVVYSMIAVIHVTSFLLSLLAGSA